MRCFVIGPIGDQLAELGSPERLAYEDAIQVFEEVIKGACAGLSIEPYRADDISDAGEIPEQIFEALRDEQLVIADLTGANPNVMYELGVRHVTGRCTIQIGEKGRLPFDVSTIRTILFKRSPQGLIQARNKLSSAIGAALANGCPPTTAGRVLQLAQRGNDDRGVEELATPADNTAESDSDSLEEPLGFLDAVVELVEGTPAFTEDLLVMTDNIKDVGALTREHAEVVGAATKPAHKLGKLANFAAELRPLAQAYDEKSLELDARTRTLDAAVAAVLDQLTEESDVEDAETWLGAMRGLAAAASNARDQGIAGYLASLRKIENSSRELRPVIQLLIAAVERTGRNLETISTWSDRADAIEERIQGS